MTNLWNSVGATLAAAALSSSAAVCSRVFAVAPGTYHGALGESAPEETMMVRPAPLTPENTPSEAFHEAGKEVRKLRRELHEFREELREEGVIAP